MLGLNAIVATSMTLIVTVATLHAGAGTQHTPVLFTTLTHLKSSVGETMRLYGNFFVCNENTTAGYVERVMFW